MSAISIKNVWKEYGEHVVLEDINLDVAPRAFIALVGPSGCGKTTFLKLLLSEEIPSRGVIEVDGKPISLEPSAERGVVFQRYSVFPHLTVLGNVVLGRELQESRFFGRLFGARRKAVEEEARDILAAVGLAGAEAKYPAACSSASLWRRRLSRSRKCCFSMSPSVRSIPASARKSMC
jgi:NitT/TauT family transport system ATP-binding protein